MAKYRIRAIGAAVAVAAGLSAALVPSAGAVEGFEFTRVFGTDRHATAAEIASDAFPAGATDVVLANGLAAFDALAGNYVAGVLGAPILLTNEDSVPDATTAALEGLAAETVHVLGGEGVVSADVVTELEGAGYAVERIHGGDRYATAAAIGAVGSDGIGEVNGKRTAIVANAKTPFDALASGPVAYSQGFPVLLTQADSLHPTTAKAIDDLTIEHVILVGGTGAVSDAVKTAIEGKDVTTERVSGGNRFATAVAIAEWAMDNISGWATDAVDLATGEDFADALAGGPAGGEALRSALLTNKSVLSPATASFLEELADELNVGRVFGGSAAVTDAVVASANQRGQGTPEGPVTGQVTSFDRAGDRYTFVPTGADAARSVTYTGNDTFTVDGMSATLGAFESALSAGDNVTYTAASGETDASHALTNVAPTSINSGTIGNVDVDDKAFDIINAVTGDILRLRVGYAGQLYRIGSGGNVGETAFEADLNEGDTIAITVQNGEPLYTLTNRIVSGTANGVETPGPLDLVDPTVRLRIDHFGDDPALGSGETGEQSGRDDKYEANEDDTFVVDGAGGDNDTFDDFSGEITEGDRVSYTRVGGVETYTLTNQPPSPISGQAVDDLDPADDDPIRTPESSDGGSFTLATANGPVSVEYLPSGAFVVNGQLATEAEFEAKYSPGDDITYQAADSDSGTTQRLTLVDRPLSGKVDAESIRTEDSASAPAAGTPGNSYAVLGDDGETELARVVYVDDEDATANTYFVNGTAVTLEAFEAELEAIKAGQKVGNVIVQGAGSGGGTVTQHRLTTAAAS